MKQMVKMRRRRRAVGRHPQPGTASQAPTGHDAFVGVCPPRSLPGI